MSSPLLLMHSSSPPLPDPQSFFPPSRFFAPVATTMRWRYISEDVEMIYLLPSSHISLLPFLLVSSSLACSSLSHLFSPLLFQTLLPSSLSSPCSNFSPRIFPSLPFFLPSFRSSICFSPAPRLYSLSLLCLLFSSALPVVLPPSIPLLASPFISSSHVLFLLSFL